MRVFVVACVVALILAIGGAAILNQFVQQASDSAYSTSGVRI